MLEIRTFKNPCEVSNENEKNRVGNWRKENHDNVEISNTEQCSSVLWKVEHLCDGMRYLAEGTSNQSIEGVASWYMININACS